MPTNLKPPRELKVIKIGNSLGVVIPKDVLAKMGVGPGDTLDLTDIPDGVSVRRHDRGFAEQMQAAREIMKRRRDALAELAK